MPTEKSAKFEVLPTPTKSASDKKEYRVIRLENGLTVCLIEDTIPPSNLSDAETDEDISENETESNKSSSAEESEISDESISESLRHKTGVVEQKMAAAALCVGVGSFSDPKEVPGMAHFLEHMISMGSEKYPAENDFDSFIQKGGGNSNASTSAETTCFYFECLEKHLHLALDKFSQFFISPLMKKEAMTREREAIESEFQMALPSDLNRKEQLMASFAKSNSPVNSFSWGNLITLRDNVSDDKLYDDVHEFRRKHYSAHRMTLAIQARLPLDTLQDYVLECFASVPNNKKAKDDFSQFSAVFDTPEFYRIYYVKPSKDVCEVNLTWSLSSLRDKYKVNPLEYLLHLLGDEGVGSLSSYLRKKLWAISVISEYENDSNSIYTHFTLRIILTDQGFQHLSEVIEAAFSYINMLKKIGPQERIFKELKTIADIGFKFAVEESAVDLVEELCESMQFYPPEDYLTANELLFEYDPELIRTVTNHLTPSKMNIMVLTTKLPDNLKYDKVEKWFGTEYTDIAVPNSWMQKWENVERYSELDIPPPNPYLTEDFSILPESDNHPDYPQKVIKTPLCEMWYRKDQKFKLPVAYYYFYLMSPLQLESPANCVLLEMMMNLLSFALAEEIYPASCADLNINIITLDKGLILKVSGYNEKLPLLIDVVSKYLLTLNDHVTEEMFSAIKDKMMKNHYNKILKPATLAKYMRLYLLVNKYWEPVEKYTSLINITFDQMKKFSRKFMESLYIKSLVQGNVSQEVATETVNKLVKNLKYAQLPENSYPRFRIVQVPLGERCCRIQGFNKDDSNSITINYYQAETFSNKTNAIIMVIMHIIEEPMFDVLRTKEQLGYEVSSGLRNTTGILGYSMTVNSQATKFTTNYVDNRIEQFLKYTQTVLKETTEEDLKQIKENLIKTKECADVHLKEEVNRNWAEIISDEYNFDILKQEIEAIKDVNIKEIREWWDKHNQFGNKENFRKISIQVEGHAKTDENDPDTKMNVSTGKDQGDIPSNTLSMVLIGNKDMSVVENKDENYFIENVKHFKESVYLYPSMQTK